MAEPLRFVIDAIRMPGCLRVIDALHLSRVAIFEGDTAVDDAIEYQRRKELARTE